MLPPLASGGRAVPTTRQFCPDRRSIFSPSSETETLLAPRTKTSAFRSLRENLWTVIPGAPSEASPMNTVPLGPATVIL